MSDSYCWDSDYSTGNFRHWEPNLSSPELAALIAAGFFRENTKILDVGCGGGLDAIFIAKYGFDVTGVDLSKEAVKIAKNRADDAEVQVDWLIGSVFDLPIETETFDFIVDRGLFHVIEDVDRPRYSSEVFRILKPSGCAVIRGAGEEVGRDRFNPLTEQAIDKFFPKTKWERGEVVPIPLYSTAGSIDARILFLRKSAKLQRQYLY
jgi:SAM-dependent methyltransferase